MTRLKSAMMLMSVLVSAIPAAAGEFPDNLYFPSRTPQHRAMEGKPAPPLNISEWIGERTNLSSLKGNVVVVDFWATWCGPCMKYIPHNVELMKKYGDKGVVVIGVHDASRGWDKAAGVVKSKGINYPVGKDDGRKSERAWNVAFWPTYAVIDQEGIVRAAALLPTSVDTVVEKLLSERPAAKKKAARQEDVPRDWLEGSNATRHRLDVLLSADEPPPLNASSWPNSEPQNLKDLAGKVVLLHFWAPKQEASVRSFEAINQLIESHAAEGLAVISIGHPNGKDRMAQIIGEMRVHHPVCVDEGTSIGTAYKVDGYPDSYLIDRKGRLRLADIRESKLEEAVVKLLAEPAPEPAKANEKQAAAPGGESSSRTTGQ